MANYANEEEEALAHKLYDTYCEEVGGKAFNGDALPHSSEFFKDEKKQLQADAWRAVAIVAFEQIDK